MSWTPSAHIVELVDHFRLEAEDHGSYSLISVPDRQRRGGRKYEKWIRQKPIGQGSFGIVWLETRDDDRSLSQEVRAVKQVVKGIVSPQSFGTNCARELYAMARLMRYPDHFADFFGWFETHDSVYFSMEYFPYGDLGICIRAPLNNDEEARIITSQILDGLKIVHQNGITHRDLKPSNIFVRSQSPWWVKIGDFGISKRIGQSTYLHTVTGTTHFMAPEIAECESEEGYTNAVDMWSLGCVLFYIMTIQVPFERRDLERYVAGRQNFPADTLLDHGASPDSVGFIEKLLAPVPGKRPSAEIASQHQWFDASDEVLATSDREQGSLTLSSGLPRVMTADTQNDMIQFNITDLGNTPWPLESRTDTSAPFPGLIDPLSDISNFVMSKEQNTLSDIPDEHHAEQEELTTLSDQSSDTDSMYSFVTVKSLSAAEKSTQERASRSMPSNLEETIARSKLRAPSVGADPPYRTPNSQIINQSTEELSDLKVEDVLNARIIDVRQDKSLHSEITTSHSEQLEFNESSDKLGVGYQAKTSSSQRNQPLIIRSDSKVPESHAQQYKLYRLGNLTAKFALAVRYPYSDIYMLQDKATRYYYNASKNPDSRTPARSAAARPAMVRSSSDSDIPLKIIPKRTVRRSSISGADRSLTLECVDSEEMLYQKALQTSAMARAQKLYENAVALELYTSWKPSTIYSEGSYTVTKLPQPYLPEDRESEDENLMHEHRTLREMEDLAHARITSLYEETESAGHCYSPRTSSGKVKILDPDYYSDYEEACYQIQSHMSYIKSKANARHQIKNRRERVIFVEAINLHVNARLAKIDEDIRKERNQKRRKVDTKQSRDLASRQHNNILPTYPSTTASDAAAFAAYMATLRKAKEPRRNFPTLRRAFGLAD